MPTKRPDILRATAEAPAVLLEYSLRAGSRLRQAFSRNKEVKKAEKYWETLGPGLVTGAAGQDPSGIATFSQTGARYGYQYLWLAAWLYPLDANIEETCARIGLATGRGLAANIRAFFSRKVLYLCVMLIFISNAINIGADLGAMAKAVQLLRPELAFQVLVIGFAVLCLGLQIFIPYAKYARYLKWLALFLLSYIVSAILAHLDWSTILKAAFIPNISFTKDAFIIICAVMGTTISPYLFFWQTSQEIEEQIQRGQRSVSQRRASTTPSVIRKMRIDVWSGMLLSEGVMFFIIAACGGILYTHGITNIETSAQAAEALRPFAGDAAYLLFSLGIIGSGLLAIPVLAGSSSYAVSESFGWNEGLYRKLGHAAAFYGTIIISVGIGLGINFLGIDPIKALIYAALINGIIAPVAMVLIMIISGNRRVMGRWVNSPLSSAVGWLTTIAMAAVGIAAIYALVS